MKLPKTFGEAFQELRSDYGAARNNRYRRQRQGIPSGGAAADWHYRSDADYLRMMELSRDFTRNDVVLGQGIERLVDNVLQDGLRLDPQTGNPELDAALAARWQRWGEDPDLCDLAGERDFHALERAALRQTIIDGDIFFFPTADGQLEAIEGHRVRTPSGTSRPVIHGVLLDQVTRRRLEYWVAREDVSAFQPIRLVNEMRRVPARDEAGYRQAFHVYNPRRISQTRGVTALAPIADTVGMHDDIQFATLVQRQLASFIAFMRERPESFTAGEPAQEGEVTLEDRGDGSIRHIEGMAPGMEILGEPGEKLQAFSANIPSSEFFPHTMLILTFIAVNLGIPVAVLLLDPSKTNFSGWRGAIDQARIGFSQAQTWLRTHFHRHVYLWKLRQWIATEPEFGAAARVLGDAIWRHRWNGSGWDYIQPEIEAKADVMKLGKGLTSPRRLHAKRGADWGDIFREQVDDWTEAIRYAKERAAELNEEFPDAAPITWRDLLPTPIEAPKAAGAAPPPPREEAEDAEDGAEEDGENPRDEDADERTNAA